MGWRFRRRVTIMPGVRINIGKRGISGLNLGPRGFSTTFGRDGSVRRNIGIPGTGLSYHQTLTPPGGGGDDSPPSGPPASTAPPPTTPPPAGRSRTRLALLAGAGVIGACVGITIIVAIVQAIAGGDDDDTTAAATATRPAPTATTAAAAATPAAPTATTPAEATPTQVTNATPAPLVFTVQRSAELVTIANNTDAPLDVSGWTVVSLTGEQRYTIPAGTVIPPGDDLTIASGSATGDLTWSESNVWNDEGDHAQLLDATGAVVAES